LFQNDERARPEDLTLSALILAEEGGQSCKHDQLLCTDLDRDDVLSLRTFLAVSYVKLNLLAFCQRFKSVTLDVAEVSEYVRTGLLLDEAEAFRVVKPFNGSSCFSHDLFLLIKSSYAFKVRRLR
jgi:hypothetical protein